MKKFSKTANFIYEAVGSISAVGLFLFIVSVGENDTLTAVGLTAMALPWFVVLLKRDGVDEFRRWWNDDQDGKDLDD